VVDNGVVSNEFWRILDCDDDLKWAGDGIDRLLCCVTLLISFFPFLVFYYSGAASAAGTSYTGALVVTKDGMFVHCLQYLLIMLMKRLT